MASSKMKALEALKKELAEKEAKIRSHYKSDLYKARVKEHSDKFGKVWPESGGMTEKQRDAIRNSKDVPGGRATFQERGQFLDNTLMTDSRMVDKSIKALRAEYKAKMEKLMPSKAERLKRVASGVAAAPRGTFGGATTRQAAKANAKKLREY